MSKPDAVPAACIETLTHSRITVKARGQVATFLNPGLVEIKKIDIDCWIPSETKADFIVSKPGVVDVIVELKGKEIDHACEQILAIHRRWKSIPPYSPMIGGLIVFTRSPSTSAAHLGIKKKFLKHGIWLEMDKNRAKDYEFESFTVQRKG